MSWSSRKVRAGATMALVATASAAVDAQSGPRMEAEATVLASPNPLLLPGSDRGALRGELTLRPGYTLTSARGSTLDLSAVVTDRVYSRRYGNVVIGRADATVDHRRSEYLSVGAAAFASRDQSIDVLTSSVEAGIDPARIRTAYGGRVTLTWHPDERSWVQPEVRADRSRFGGSDLLTDTHAIAATVAASRQVSARTKLGLRGGVISSDSGRLSGATTSVFYATANHRVNARWRVSGELGAERNGARVEQFTGLRVAQPARTLLSGRAQLCREAPGPVLCLNASLNSEVSGLGGLQRRAMVAGTFDKRLSERSTLALAAEYQRTVMQGSIFPDFDAIRTVATVERRLRRDLRLGATVQYLRRRTLTGERIGAAYAGLRLVFTRGVR